MRKVVANFLLLSFAVAVSAAPSPPQRDLSSAELEAINRRLEQLDQLNDKKPAVTSQENRIRLEQSQKVVQDIKAILKKDSRKLQGGGGMANKLIDSLDKYLNFLPKAMGVKMDGSFDKTASMLGQGFLVKGVNNFDKRRLNHIRMVRELKLKMKARDVYLSSLDKNRNQLQVVAEKLRFEPQYFAEKKRALKRLFNDLVRISD